MKIIALGDTHGRDHWKRITDTQTFDKLVLIGDYFDSFQIDAAAQIRNFQALVTYKQAHPGKLVLLFGNHDFHYLPVAMRAGEVYTGFQEAYAGQISELIQAHLPLMQMCYGWQNYLFTHAGVTTTWIRNAGYEAGNIEAFINGLFKTDPAQFLFNGWEPSGENTTQSPIWVRPASLTKNAFQYQTLKQVVGHTRVKTLRAVKNRYYFIDTLDASREFLVVENGVVSVGSIV